MNRFKAISLATISVIALNSSFAFAGWEVFKPANIAEKISKAIAKQEIGASLSVLTLEMFDGLGLAAKYRIESEPSFVNGYYTRVDKYTMDMDVNPWDIIGGMDTPIFFNIQKGGEIFFARQFKSQKESLLATPYHLKNLPLTAEKAIRNLNPGDFVGLESNLNFVLGIGTSALNGGLTSSATTSVYISGKFLVQLFRMPNNKMRVKLISLNTKGAGAAAGTKYESDLKIVGFSYVENKLEKLIDFSPVDLGVGVSKNNIFMLDYIFDLNNSLAAQAYNDMMTKKLQFKDLVSTNPLMPIEKMKKDLLTDLSSVELLSVEDRLEAPAKRRVNRLFKGTNESNNRNAHFKLGFNLAKYQTGKGYSKAHVNSIDRQEVSQKYILETTTNYYKTKFLFGLWGANVTNTTSLLFLADNSFNPTDFIAFSNDKVKKEKDFDIIDLDIAKSEVRSLIPTSEFNKINWGLYNFKKGNFINSAYRITSFFHPAAVAALPKLSAQQFSDKFEQYVENSGGNNRHTDREVTSLDLENAKITGMFSNDFDSIGEDLHNAISPLNAMSTRLNSFSKLKNYPIWEKKGLAFLISLLPKDRVTELVSFEFALTSKNGPSLSHRFGKFENERLYESLVYTQNVISNQGFDLRLWTDDEGDFIHNQTRP